MPEISGTAISVQNPYLPNAIKLFEERACGSASDAAPSQTSNNEEFRYIESIRITRDHGAGRNKRKSRELPFSPHEERSTSGVAPVQGEAGVVEATVLGGSIPEEFAEVVEIEVQEVLEYGSI